MTVPPEIEVEIVEKQCNVPNMGTYVPNCFQWQTIDFIQSHYTHSFHLSLTILSIQFVSFQVRAFHYPGNKWVTHSKYITYDTFIQTSMRDLSVIPNPNPNTNKPAFQRCYAYKQCTYVHHLHKRPITTTPCTVSILKTLIASRTHIEILSAFLFPGETRLLEPVSGRKRTSTQNVVCTYDESSNLSQKQAYLKGKKSPPIDSRS